MGSGIYRLISPSGKSYVGQSFDIKDRLRHYRRVTCKGQVKVYRALKKYGWDGFEVEILYSTKKDMTNIATLLNILEKAYIKKFDCVKNGYNIREGGSNSKLSKETRMKLSIAHTGKKLSEEHKLKMSIAMKGRIMTDIHKKRISEGQKGKIIPLKQREQISKTMTGIKLCKKRAAKSAKSRWISVNQYGLDGKYIATFSSLKEAAEKNGANRSHITDVCKGRLSKTGGFKWEYAN